MAGEILDIRLIDPAERFREPQRTVRHRATGNAPVPLWLPEVYQLHQRIVDLEGYIHVDGHIYSVPYQLIGKSVEVRETKDQVRVFVGPREVAVHNKVIDGPSLRDGDGSNAT